MLNKTILAGPVTQTAAAVKQLIAYHNHGQEPEEMPDFYRLTGEMVLVLSNKKDAYYVTTPKTCSCPAATYHPGPCKHSRKYFPEPKTIQKQSMADTLEQADKNLHKMPYKYQRMVRAAREEAEAESLLDLDPERKPFKPFIEDEARAAGAA